jgi:hypothetical protein
MNAVSSSELLGRNAGVVFAYDIDDLRLGKFAPAHEMDLLACPLGGNPQVSLAPDSGPIPGVLTAILCAALGFRLPAI